jgi:hypothetical protein
VTWLPQAKMAAVMLIASAEKAWVNLMMPVSWDSESTGALHSRCAQEGSAMSRSNASGNTLRVARHDTGRPLKGLRLSFAVTRVLRRP